MEKAKKIVRNSAWALSARVIDILSNLLLLAIVARYLGVEDFGHYSLIMAIYWVVFPFLLMATRILSRDIAQDNSKADSLLGSAMNILALSAALGFVVIALYGLIVRPPGQDLIIAFIVLVTMFFMAASRTLTAVFYAFEKMRYDMIISICSSLIGLIFTVVVAYLDLGFAYLFVSMMFAYLMSLVVSAYIMMSRFSFRPSFRFDKEKAAYLLKESYHIAVYTLLIQLYFNVGVFALKLLGTTFDVGIYQAPYRVLNRMMIIPITLSIATMPMLSQLAASEDSREEFRYKIAFILKILVMLCLPITMLVFVLSDKIVFILFGSAFKASIAAMQIQILALGFFFVNVLFETTLVCLKRQRFLNMIGGLGLVTAVALNVYLIPGYGYVGSSIAVPLSQTVMFLMGVFYLSDVMKAGLLVNIFLKPLIIAVITGLALYLVSGLNSYLLAAAGLAIYVALLVAFRVFSLAEVRQFRTLIGKPQKLASPLS
ncbi:MAG: hypothetical protein A3J24_00850 [Deltaproteobacteria bacterium RIFCSPLOWO2_02_FULL_53_8]|nr:MAG: hypothetical protein A3J24_00850 [Deltaproteobacteria bacterium RIFCSPLOWO2_02_FULL_53_8]